jgi:ATP-binding cassette subfamily B protein
MRRISAERALLVIAHRISTVRAADWIIVLDDGAVVASGRHEDLVRASPRYRQLATTGRDTGDTGMRGVPGVQGRGTGGSGARY